GPLGQALARREVGGVRGLAPGPLDPLAQAELWSRRLALAVPVVAHGVTTGFLGVGRKLSGGALSAEDAAFLAAGAAQAGAAGGAGGAQSARVGRYRLERRLGTGGMAEVHLAWQLGPGGFERKVALKRPLPHLSEDEGAVTLFLDEAKVAA